MKLRSFLYLNTDMLNSYLAAIDGGVYDSETVTETRASQKTGGVVAGIGTFSGNAQAGGGSSEEVKKDIQISPPAKFNRLFEYLQQEGQGKYYQFIHDDTFKELERDDFIEILVKPRFSKVKEITNAAKSIGEMAEFFQELSDVPVFDDATKKGIDSVAKLGELKPSKAISCVFNFEDNEVPIVVNLDEQYFQVSQDNFVGEVYVLCKIQRKLQKNEKIELDELFEQFNKIPLNREQRRQLSKKDLKNPKEFKDVVNGPAFTASVIAVYQ